MRIEGLSRWKAAAIYLGLSAAVGATIVGVMLLVWYPWPYFEAMGGITLILLMVGVDLILGPLIVLIVFNPAKRSLKLDLAIIASLQLVALAYGGYVMFQARPVYVAYVVDRFEVVPANRIDDEALAAAKLPEFKTLPYTGPRVIAVYPPTDPDEQLRAIDSALNGGPDLSALPRYYVPYAQLATKAAARAKPLEVLGKGQPERTSVIQSFVTRSGRRQDEMGFLPMTARNYDMAAVLDLKSGEILDILQIDPW